MESDCNDSFVKRYVVAFALLMASCSHFGGIQSSLIMAPRMFIGEICYEMCDPKEELTLSYNEDTLFRNDRWWKPLKTQGKVAASPKASPKADSKTAPDAKGDKGQAGKGTPKFSSWKGKGKGKEKGKGKKGGKAQSPVFVNSHSWQDDTENEPSVIDDCEWNGKKL